MTIKESYFHEKTLYTMKTRIISKMSRCSYHSYIQQLQRTELSKTDLYFKGDRIVSVLGDSDNLDEQINSMLDATENCSTRKNGQRFKAFICKVCGKEAEQTDLKRHIEAFHISGITHSCEVCGKISRSRRGLRIHTDREHNN